MQGTVELDDPKIPPLQREHDSYLMDHVLQAGFDSTTVGYINLACLHLQVVTVSDLAQPDGRRLDPTMRQGELSLMSSQPQWYRCHQEKPTADYVWKAWRQACALVSSCNGTLH